MTNKPKILVAIDFSDASRRALDWAAEHARRLGAELHLVHVVEDSFLEMIGGAPKHRLEHELSLVYEKAVVELGKLGTEAAEPKRHVARGHAAAEILSMAERIQPSLIVIGNHGRTFALIGSTAERVVRHAACTVVCVKGGK